MVLLLLPFVGCRMGDAEVDIVVSPKGALLEMFRKFDELAEVIAQSETELDELVSLNEAIRQDIESIRGYGSFEKLVELLEQEPNITYAVVSPDKQLVIFTWKTGLEKLGYSLKSIALYKSDGKVLASSLYGKKSFWIG